MKRAFIELLASLVIFFLFVASPIVFAQPESWDVHTYIDFCFFHGTATIDGENVAVGDVVGAFVNKDSVNDLCIGKYTVTTAGLYGLLNAYGDDDGTPGEKDGALEGETVYFKIWDASLDRISYAVPEGDNQWEGDQINKEVNLSATSGISANVSGTRQDTFDLGETIYGQAVLGLQAEQEYDLYVVVDQSPWSDGAEIPTRVNGSESSFQTDGSGNLPAGTTLYSNPTPGNYDIIIDVNGNGSYNDNVDYLDDSPQVGAKSLPVKLSLFTATAAENGITICWRTETEINNLGFSIYRSGEQDGNYTKIAFISGAGSSAMSIDYQFTDQKVERGKTYFYYLEDVDLTGERKQSEVIKVINAEFSFEVIALPLQPVLQAPTEFRLLPNYPNPFNPETWIPYQLPEASSVMIQIFNLKGQIVRTIDLGLQNAGNYVTKGKAAYWDGQNDFNQPVASGVYVYTLQAGKFKAARKMLIVK